MGKIGDYRRRIQAVMEKRCPNGKIEERGIPWTLIGERKTPYSFDYAFSVPSGYSVKDLRQETDAIYAACGAIVEIKDHAGVVVVSVYPDDYPDAIPLLPDMIPDTKKEVLLGLNRQLEPITHSFTHGSPHLMIAGMSGYGKTEILKNIIFQLLINHSPDEIEIQIIDLKGFSFLPFRRIPHISRIVRDLPGTVEVLSDAHKKMIERSNVIWAEEKKRSFKHLFIILDEAAEIAPKLKNSKDQKQLALIADEYCSSLSRIGREANISLIYCTQRPDANVINPQVKANMDAAICFRTKTQSNSEIILDRAGAERLPNKKPGRAIYSALEDVTLQVPYVGKDEIWEEILKPWREEYEAREDTESAEYDEHLAHFIDGSYWETDISWQPFPEQESVRNTKRVRAN